MIANLSEIIDEFERSVQEARNPEMQRIRLVGQVERSTFPQTFCMQNIVLIIQIEYTNPHESENAFITSLPPSTVPLPP